MRKTELSWGLAIAAIFAALAISHRWIHDDGFINLRIVRNIVDGYGPVFNPGERVEAGTSPLWLACLALLHALHAPLEWSAVTLGIACTCLAIVLMPFAQISPRSTAARARAFDGRAFPVGLVAFAAVPAAWDYASAGLETGLACLWIVGATVLVAAAAERRVDARGLYAAAFVCGLGPLIRPDFLVYTALFLLVLVLRVFRDDVLPKLARAGRCARLLSLAMALPLLVEVLRMAYFGTLAPNTALAKEAFRLNVPQGVCYVKNFVMTYWLGMPLLVVAFLWLTVHARRFGSATFLTFVAFVPMLGAMLHAGYLAVIGGDYMHARLLLPDLIAFAIPVSLARFVRLRAEDPRTFYPAAAAVIMTGWAVACVSMLRPAKENVCFIGDEHGWYTRLAENPRPVLVGDYRKHPFFQDRTKGLGGGRLLIDEKAQDPLATSVDARVTRGLFAGAIGITGFSLPTTVFVVDKHGLADPVVARFELAKRDRPGHEKSFTRAWVLARFAERRDEDPGDVQAARHALSCGALGDLMRSVSSPLTGSQALWNIVHARANNTLRIPVDPFDAEAKFCGYTLTRTLRGGNGGEAFTTMCPQGAPATGLRVVPASGENAIGAIGLLCGPEYREEPMFGDAHRGAAVLSCPDKMYLAGIWGDADRFLRRVGPVCATKDGTIVQAQAIGTSSGIAFQLQCPSATRVGLSGRFGSLVDAVGVACVNEHP